MAGPFRILVFFIFEPKSAKEKHCPEAQESSWQPIKESIHSFLALVSSGGTCPCTYIHVQHVHVHIARVTRSGPSLFGENGPPAGEWIKVKDGPVLFSAHPTRVFEPNKTCVRTDPPYCAKITPLLEVPTTAAVHSRVAKSRWGRDRCCCCVPSVHQEKTHPPQFSPAQDAVNEYKYRRGQLL